MEHFPLNAYYPGKCLMLVQSGPGTTWARPGTVKTALKSQKAAQKAAQKPSVEVR